MAKASDILNRAGGSGMPLPKPTNTVNVGTAAQKDASVDEAGVTAKKPDMGHNFSRGGKAQGGAGQSAARPKV